MALLITQPVGIRLSSLGDIDFTARRLSLVTGMDGVVQGVRTRMKLVRGELFYDLDLGVPYFARDGVPRSVALLGQKFNPTKARAAMRPPILRTPGVLGIAEMVITFDGSTRNMAVTWRATTVWGDTPADTLEIALGGS